MSSPSEELRALIDEERTSDVPPAAVVEHGWARLESAIGAGLPPPNPGLDFEPKVDPLVPTKAAALTSSKLGVVLAATLAGGAATWALTRDADEPVQASTAQMSDREAEDAPASVPPSNPDLEPPVVPEAPPEDDEPTPQQASPSPPGRVAGPKQQDSADRLAAELALIEEARRALAARNPQRALELARRHARLHPSGTLAEEREAIEAVALCELGRPRGRVVADRFLREHPRSTHIDRVRSACIHAPEVTPTRHEEE
jgi:hypothetical protein